MQGQLQLAERVSVSLVLKVRLTEHNPTEGPTFFFPFSDFTKPEA